MPMQRWSDDILVVDLQDDPGFTDDLAMLFDQQEDEKITAVVMNLAGVTYLNSSNIAKLLKLRKKLLNEQRRLILCGISTNVWGLVLVTGLEKVFEFTDTVGTALASVQMTSD